MSAVVVFGLLAGVATVLAIVPYVRDVLRGTTRPHRGSWLIWTVLSIVVFASQLADGASWSIVMVAAQALITGLVFVLSIWRGEGGVPRADLTIMAIAGLGVVAWAVSSTPVVATIATIFADMLGIALMTPKTWRDPRSETFSTYVLGGVAGVLSAFAVGSLDISLLLFPIWIAVASTIIATTIAMRRSRVHVIR
jgi:hypothetical protein